MAHDEGRSEAVVLALGHALHTAGMPAHRLEERLAHVAHALGLDAQFFSTPTSLMIGFGPLGAQRTRIIRVNPGELDLARLEQLDGIARRLVMGDLDADRAIDAITRSRSESQQIGSVALVLVYAALSATSARFFGGGAAEIAIGGAIGAIVGLLAVVWPRVTTGAPVFELLAAGFASFLVTATAALIPDLHVSIYIATLSGLVGLLPGFSLTVAVTELATRHLASGTARATAAAITLLQLAVGIAFGERLATAAFGTVAEISPMPLPGWTEAIALAASPIVLLAFTHAPWKRLTGICVVCFAGYLGARIGGDALGRELGAAIGAFIVALLSRAHAIWFDSTQLVTLVPAFLLLVPGSFGFKSVSLFLGQDVTSGIDAALRMMLIAMAISAGLLVAQAIGAPRHEAPSDAREP